MDLETRKIPEENFADVIANHGGPFMSPTPVALEHRYYIPKTSDKEVMAAIRSAVVRKRKVREALSIALSRDMERKGS